MWVRKRRKRFKKGVDIEGRGWYNNEAVDERVGREDLEN